MSARKLVAIMFTDIVGYTAVVGEDESKGVEARRKHRRLVEALVAQFDGRSVEETGDESLSSFGSAVDAVRCALAVQAVLDNDPQLSVRIGIHIGDVLEQEGRLIGDAVNVAARLRPLANPGGVCVSERVYEDIRNHPELSATFVGERELKNVAQPVRVYALPRSVPPDAGATTPAQRKRSPRRLALLTGIGLALVGLAAATVLDSATIWMALLRGGLISPGPSYEQEIGFTTTRDGVRIAWSTLGDGPQVVIVQGWFTHLERGAYSPGWNPFAPVLMAEHRLIQFDGRGTGLSDLGVDDYSLEGKLMDLEAVVDAAGLDRFALFGISSGGATVIAYAARHPERVTRVAFYGAFANLASVPEQLELWKALVPAVRVGWGEDNPAYRQIFTSLFMPDGEELEMRVFNEVQKVATTPQDAAAFMQSLIETNVTQQASEVRAPTLVIHLDGDRIVPFEYGREIASLIPGARLQTLEGDNHAFLTGDPAFQQLLDTLRDWFAQDLATRAVGGPS